MEQIAREKCIVFKTPKDGHYFSGYYDKSPLDFHGRKMLAMKVDFIDRLPGSEDHAQIGYFDLNSGNFTHLTDTNSFNWQQGAMLQWIGPQFSEEIAFNRREGDGFKGIIFNITNGLERELPYPVYVLDQSGKWALSIDFERHYWCRRGYAYDGIIKPEKCRPVVEDDGIWITDLASLQSKQIVRVENLLKFRPLASMDGATHYVEHMMFAPGGKHFSFYHRWKLLDGGLYTRFYVVDVSGENLRLIHDTGRVSHHCWIDDNTILAIGSEKTSLASGLRKYRILSRLAKPLLPIYKSLVKGNSVQGQTKVSSIFTGDTYFTIDIRTMETRSMFRQTLDRDGHPTAIPGRGNWIVTDTYPDSKSQAQLIVADLATQSTVTIDTLDSLSQFDNSPMRCDLHPKISYNGRFVAIDTMNDGVRGMYLYSLPDLMPSNSNT